ncbi:uncharacterized protein LOC123715395 [Pieris brassicae]|uniref:uncharacterized protein LOC123715395 n=1 Tax=Pieris brassicae TaxID=7116 RepID=UPI001E661BE4|nr:uncharacterized protein LOC123715395 [Pieris brassicae]
MILIMRVMATYIVFLTVFVSGYDKIKDLTDWNDRKRIRAMGYELIKEAQLKIRQLDGLKDEANPFTAFAVGTLLGRIREKYRSMLELYRMTKNKYTGAANLTLPNVDPRRPLHNIIRLEEVRGLELEIDQMVYMLQNLDDNAPAFDLSLLVGNAKPRPKSTTPEPDSQDI